MLASVGVLLNVSQQTESGEAAGMEAPQSLRHGRLFDPTLSLAAATSARLLGQSVGRPAIRSVQNSLFVWPGATALR